VEVQAEETRAEARAAPARESVEAAEAGERKKDVCSMKMATAAHPLLFTAYITVKT